MEKQNRFLPLTTQMRDGFRNTWNSLEKNLVSFNSIKKFKENERPSLDWYGKAMQRLGNV